MNLVGTIHPGDHIFTVAANTKRVSRYIAPRTGRIAKLTIYCDGFGTGQGNQVMRGIIYDSQGNLLGIGDEVLILDNQEPGWVDLLFSADEGGVPVTAGVKYDFGYHAGQNTNVIRVYGATATGF